MAQSISIKPGEKSTALVLLSPIDENGTHLSFAQLNAPQWQLMQLDGTIVNNRTFANSNMTKLETLLEGDDLAMFGPGDSGYRIFSFQARYDSSNGFNLLVVAEGKFQIDRMLGQVDQT